MKRAFDILFSSVALILLSPFFIVAAVLIKLDSRGKIFFVQKRVGKNFKEFSLLKFRTMREDSEKSGMLTIGHSDSRITRLGFYLRKYKLDELPQLINVLKGDMSIVGPRPEVKKYVEMYIGEQKKVLSVKPGITDIASIQFSGESELLAKYPNPEEVYVKEIMPKKLALSLEYIEKENIMSDIAIIGKTFGKIFSPFSSLRQFENLLLALLVFSLPLYEKATAWLAVSVVLIRLFDRNAISDLASLKRNILPALLIAFYLAHVVGTFYSSNLHYAFFDLQIKLPFLFFPLLLSVPLSRPEVLQVLKKYFIAGCTVAALLCLVLAIRSYSKSGDPFDFFYTPYSRFIHVTYFSMFLNLCILFLIDELMMHSGKAAMKITLLVFLSVTVILLNARTAMFTCLITSLFYAVIMSVQRGVLRRTYIAIAVLSVLLTAAGIYANHVYNRFTEISEVFQKIESKKEVTDGGQKQALQASTESKYNSVSTRIEVWKDSWELIKKNALFGVGTGDIKDVLQAKFAERKFYYGVEKKFNPHNQFLHTTLMLGLMGLLILVMLLAIPAWQALKNKNYLFIFFYTIISLNCMTESILEVQRGVLFFCVFSLALFNLQKTD